jgi:hypothetical protein
MLKANIKCGLSLAVIGLALSFLAANWVTTRQASAQSSAAPTPGNQTSNQASNPDDPPAEQAFKNIQVLKGMPKSQMDPVMNMISAALGMRCEQCHVPDAMEKDDKRVKQTARRMIQMVFDINKNSFNGRPQISCNTCHRGQDHPVNVPPFSQTMPQTPAAASNQAPRAAQGQNPTFDQILEKYVEAVGGRAAYEKLTSRAVKGSMVAMNGQAFPVEIYQAAPNKMVTIIAAPNGSSAQGFNGTIGWVTNPDRQGEIKGQELARLKRSADLARPIKFKEEYLNPRVVRTRIGEREVYQVNAQADGQRVTLFFDAQTGLLHRRVVTTTTVLGAFPEQTDFEDYREVDGVKLPFVTKQSSLDPRATSTLKFTEVKHNIAVDEAKFNPPAQK